MIVVMINHNWPWVDLDWLNMTFGVNGGSNDTTTRKIAVSMNSNAVVSAGK